MWAAGDVNVSLLSLSVCLSICDDDSPTGAAFGSHARVVLKNDITIVIEIEESQ